MERNLSDKKCAICKGDGHFMDRSCVYCNGTGEWNKVAEAYVRNHICQCIILDRVWCPVCHKKCHHDASLSPKQKIEPGPGGISYINHDPPDTKETKVEEVTA